jgi:hypothetical protein
MRTLVELSLLRYFGWSEWTLPFDWWRWRVTVPKRTYLKLSKVEGQIERSFPVMDFILQKFD